MCVCVWRVQAYKRFGKLPVLCVGFSDNTGLLLSKGRLGMCVDRTELLLNLTHKLMDEYCTTVSCLVT